MNDLENKVIGDVIQECVPDRFHLHFQRTEDENGGDEWWSYGLDLDDEESIGTHVWNLLPITNEMFDWMPDATEEFIESVWKGVANQCLTWVYG